ncbi:MAG: NapC/NirT family cytochrome c [Caldilineaceae bacterium]
MNVQPSSSRKKIWGFTSVLVGIVVLGIFLAAGSFTYVASQEARDPFCASCHTEPEATFYQRSIDAHPVDLASYHTGEQTRCIDCHSGPGVTGRLQAELLGARNAALWYMGHATQPAPLTVPIADANCLKCHQAVTQRGYTAKLAVTLPELGREREEGEEGGPNHWHEELARWQANDPNAATCVSCHPGHPTDGTAQTGFQVGQATRAVCDACHRAPRRGRRG